MAKITKHTVMNEPPLSSPEQRFPRSAVDYIDTLLDVQRKRFEAENKACPAHHQETAWPPAPKKASILVESDGFVGSGWGPLDLGADGTARRWMARLGTVMLAIDASAGGILMLTGGGSLKRRYIKELTFWLNNMPLEGTAAAKGLRNWRFETRIPAQVERPFHILGIQSPRIRAFDKGPSTHASIALSRIEFRAD